MPTSEPSWELTTDAETNERWLSWWHNCVGTGGFRALSRLPLDVPNGWTIEREEPLTISPSIRCITGDCTVHGFIRAGKWTPA